MRRYLVPVPISLTISAVILSFIYSFLPADPIRDAAMLFAVSLSALAGQIAYWAIFKRKPSDLRSATAKDPVTNVVNEMGVIAAFASRCVEMGYVIIKIQAPFPDAIIQDTETGRIIVVEFEYKASAFKAHGHDVDECDMIICWLDDWKDCPLPVLSLYTTPLIMHKMNQSNIEKEKFIEIWRNSDPGASKNSVAIENGVPPTTARRWTEGLER